MMRETTDLTQFLAENETESTREFERKLDEEFELADRYQQLAEVARDMLICVNDPLDFAERTGEKYMRNGHYEWSSIFRERLEELGVEL